MGGVHITGSLATFNTLEENYIGTDPGGTSAMGVQAVGILIDSGPSFNNIGTRAPGEGNIISGNQGNGVTINNSNYNDVYANLIGTNDEDSRRSAIPGMA